MFLDVTGVVLVPGNQGEYCPGNGKHMGVECCCEECDYMLCCLDPESTCTIAVQQDLANE